MPTPSHADLRRLVVALALAGLVHAASTAAIGAVVADSGPSADLPAELSVRPPRAGDEAVYGIDATGQANASAATIDQFTASWGTPTWAHGLDGTARRVMPLQIQVIADPPAGDGPRLHVRKLGFDVVSWDPVSTVETDDRQVPSGGLPADDLRRVHHRIQRKARLDDVEVPCGFAVPFLAGPVPITGPVDGSGSCGTPSGSLRATEVRDRQGLRVVSFTGSDGDVEVAYSPQVPFPVEVRAEAASVLPGDPPSGTVHLRLQGFRSGQGSGPDGPVGVDPEPRPWVPTGQARPWGPPEGDLDHPFPLSAAWEVLVEESPAVQSFRRDHPDAYVAWARLRVHTDQADRDHLYWRIVLTDGTDRMDRYVSDQPRLRDRIRDPTDPDRVHRPSQVPFPSPELAEAFPDPSAAPDRLPVVEAAFDRYRALDPALADAGPPDRWHLAVRCETGRCDQARTELSVGDDPEEGDQVQLVLDADGRRRAVHEEATTPTGIYVESFHSAGPTREWTRAVPGPATWSLARWEIAAGAGALALLAGALYYLWPKIKLAAGGLYSRIGPDDVLDNESRRRIHRLVKAEPGIHFREIKRRLDLGRGNLEHHLDKLVDNGILHAHSGQGYRCYFPEGRVDRRVAEVAEHLRSDNARTLLSKLSSVSDPSIRDLARRASIPESTASYHVGRLDEADLIDKRRTGGRLVLRLTELGRRALKELKIA